MEGERHGVLVVEDDPSLRLLSRVNLELAGFAVREAATLADARAAVAAERPDVVFLDVHLGSEQSDDFLDELRAAGMPVVLVTGTADASSYRQRASEVLAKPYAPEELVAAARRLTWGA
ncbi:MAG: response regulator [Actinobacteria bacterium]|nr:response regulator [Actinomycetota bacterium]MBV8395890.1 response regulator [Actinomycetota bacterium]MBV8598207.1 response regulator [Actinomycetota bacterium]